MSTQQKTWELGRDKLRLATPVNDAERRSERFRALLDAGRAQLTTAARRLCHYNDDCVVEMVQATVVRAYQAYMRGLCRFDQNVGGWMVRILTNYFINDYRSRTRHLTRSSLDELTANGQRAPVESCAPTSETPDGILLATTLDEPLEKALEALPDKLREAVLLVDVQQFSYEEAAKMLDVPVGTIRSRLYRARLLLYNLLHEYALDRRII